MSLGQILIFQSKIKRKYQAVSIAKFHFFNKSTYQCYCCKTQPIFSMEMNYAKPRFFFIYYIFVNSLELIPSISFSACVSTLSRFFSRNRSSHRRCSVRKAVLTNFSKFTGKQLCQYLFFNNVVSDLKVRLKQKYNSRTFHCHIFCFK